jgi:hypothetical protein
VFFSSLLLSGVAGSTLAREIVYAGELNAEPGGKAKVVGREEEVDSRQ